MKKKFVAIAAAATLVMAASVSYTHLDVYKRQAVIRVRIAGSSSISFCRLGAYFSIRSSRGARIPIRPYFIISVFDSKALTKTSGYSLFAHIKLFFSSYPSAARTSVKSRCTLVDVYKRQVKEKFLAV